MMSSRLPPDRGMRGISFSAWAGQPRNPHSGGSVLNIAGEDSGKTFYLEFDGVMNQSEVYVNGHPAGAWPYGCYTSFHFDFRAV